MRITVSDDVAATAAAKIADLLRQALADRDRASLAVSGGTTPWLALEQLAKADLPWDRIDVFQVDERVAPEGDPARNLTLLRSSFADHVPARVIAMPVNADDLYAAAEAYAKQLPDRIDVVQLGLGADGHTASLVPGDPVLAATAPVAMTEPYSGHRRMTLTYGPIDRARTIVWIVTGASKQEAITQLLDADPGIPAGRVTAGNAILLADQAALGDRPINSSEA